MNDPDGKKGIAIDFGGDYTTGWGGSSGEGGSAGTGVYFGATNWYAEFGGFTYQQFLQNSGKTPGAAIGGGANVTLYFTDANDFFPGEMDYVNYVIGPFSMTFHEQKGTGKLTGATLSFGGKGLGWVIHEEGHTIGQQFIGQGTGQYDAQTGEYDFDAKNTSFEWDISVMNGASGGFVLYPNKPNTNMMQQVYKK